MSAVTITMPPVVRAADAEPPNALPPFDIEQVRVGLERTFAAALEAHPLFARVAAACTPPSDQEIRRHLMAASLRLSEAMAPEAYRVAHEARRILRVDGALELYQRSGPENAAMHRVAAPILLELHGSLMPRLDGPALLALIGHELGHYLAHGPASPPQPALRIPGGAVDEVTFEALQSRLSMACELTADRVALLACQDLGALLRLMLVTVSGLAVGELTYDTDAYLAQCKDLIEEDLRVGAVAKGDSHPEHGLRVYAAWLFSETRLYRELTGRGPGTREVADVDAVIARCLGTSGRRIHDPVQAADVPRELLECGLAAAVLVAQADSSVTEDEAILLERVFASEIPDWQSYLEPGVAAERFLDTAAVLVPIAQEIGPTLLNLLFAVMSADQAIEGREISMLLQIGACLGLREPFARRLIAMLRQRGIHLDLTTIAPPEQPLPARSQDVDEALHTFLAGVARRGETATTLRRMLRLLGSDRRDDDLIGRLVRTLVAQHISFTPALTDVGLDERVVLTPASAPPVRTSQAIAVSGSRAGLLAALRRLREQLVSGDGRSPSVRLRAVRRGRSFDLTALERVSVGLAERVMAQVRARKAVRVIDAADAGRHGPAAAITADLLALAREDLARTEETGARELYVGYPFVTGTVGGYLIRAPLVLYPVELTREGAGARGFRLEPRRDELPLANQSLIRLVFNKRGFAFSDELADELEALAGDPDGGPEAVRRRLAEVGLPLGDGAAALQPFGEVADTTLFGEQAPAIEEVAILGMFPQSSSDLLQDYDGLLHDLARPDAEIGALLGAAATLLPDGPTTTAVAAAAEVGPDWAPVIPADPSQRSVVAEARRHGATVIDGPPGTGKSQVIVNLVAEAVRRGERVAVVCEKRAALDVVRQRMTAIGFGKALAVVHDVYEDRKPLFAHITGRLEAAGKVPFAAAEADAVHAEHAKVRDALAQRSEALRMTPDGLELSVGELLALQAEHARTDVPPVAGLDHVTQAGLRTLLDATVALQPLVDLWGPGGRWPVGGVRPRRSLATGAPTVVADLEAAIAAALPLAQAFEQRQAGLPSALSLEQIDAARAALTEAVRSRPLRGDERDAATFGTIAQLAATDPERLRATAQAREALREDTTALVRLDRPVTFGGGPELVASLSVLSRWSRSWYRIFIGAWR
ncbi:MAG TPA: DUF4011 domain-containing protein, partial [Kofleriaceae bacterium]|nr:DUF4011 domain-containing protein [Kofleriaceae bacterium]